VNNPAAGIGTLVVVLLLVAVCPAAEASPAAPADYVDGRRLALERHYFVLNDGRRVSGRWGELSVPENWNDPRSRNIQLTFGLLPSTSSGDSSAIFFIAGGPGASGIGSFAGNARLLQPLRRFGNLLLVEQRGSGFSRPRLDCVQRWSLSLQAPLRREELIGVARERFAACRRDWEQEGVDLAGYNTKAYARDIVAVADAMGYERFSVVAFSYGTQVALELMRAAPGRVTRSVLLGVMGPSDTLRNPMDHDAVLERAATLLARDPASSVYPDLVSATQQAIARLRREPVRVSLPGADGMASTEFVFDELAFRQQMVIRLGIRDELANLPRFIRALLGGDDQQWLQGELRKRFSGVKWMREGPLAMRSAAQHYATVCAAADPSPRERAPPDCVLGHTFHPSLPEACDAWQVPNLGDAFRRSPVSDAPVLIFSADLDTKTPMGQTLRLLPGLGRGQHVVMQNAGHDDLLEVDPRVQGRIIAFFQGKPVETSPIALDPIRFAIPDGSFADCPAGTCPSPDAETRQASQRSSHPPPEWGSGRRRD
jgi:pimeloyl-ACP methyl ester carboxylesterase